MIRKIRLDGIESAPVWIVAFLGAYSLVHLLVLYAWNGAGQAFSIQATSGGTSVLSVAGMAAVGLWLCLVVLRTFPAGSPLRSAWLLLALAAAVQAASIILGQFLGSDWLLNPLVWTGHATPALLSQIRHAALMAAGPLRLALLAGAILPALRILREFGFWARPSAADRAIFGVFCLFALCRFGEAGAASLSGESIPLEDWISLAGLPILCVLFLEAMLLRQAVARMGSGLVARGWLALVFGIFLTGAGEAALWVIPHYSLSLPMAGLAALNQLLLASAFALVPACQVAAQRQAVRPVTEAEEDLSTSLPAMVR